MKTPWFRRPFKWPLCGSKSDSTFQRREGSGYFFTSDDHEELIHRPKSIFDQAIPSGNSIALECMSVLSEIDESVMVEFSTEFEKQLFGV